ncbi:hypothetical protein SPRG_00141 [Saprolegnia parasitica CBS 223.65]|uniref:Uncharacterized protein n=1 Tax=Saprolegnia parasitica (strain CBS 223.65) TaxID=695850 RepID=A0A067CXT1_SAPPC|nr:hypothetical protein SPRG_00141 [Saprolegnia parasitica CBS 223.65]KDO35293.1 hypothetical protein SPRG_00141 [Saprolegnia parasitica CBS 223.65]|eukprot:XP_012193640.1 hypothetical protein SPRG_00141 [Saprolegnia parasitica CBS 223.65]
MEVYLAAASSSPPPTESASKHSHLTDRDRSEYRCCDTGSRLPLGLQLGLFLLTLALPARERLQPVLLNDRLVLLLRGGGGLRESRSLVGLRLCFAGRRVARFSLALRALAQSALCRKRIKFLLRLSRTLYLGFVDQARPLLFFCHRLPIGFGTSRIVRRRLSGSSTVGCYLGLASLTFGFCTSLLILASLALGCFLGL